MASPRRRTIGPLVLRLHFYAGVLVAPFLVVAALTGLAFVFSPQLDRIVYAHELRVDPGGAARPLAEQVAAAVRAHPDGSVGTVIPPVAPTDPTKVVFNLPELGEKQHTVYVDPYTNELRGTLTTWFGSTPLQTWLDDLHRNLHLGVVGRHYSELAASWLWLVALGGLFLWLRRQWMARATLRRTVLPDLSAKVGVRRTRGWHAATGVWLVVGLLALSATGLTWSRYAGANFDVLRSGLNADRPVLDTALPGTAPGGDSGGGHHDGGASSGGEAAIADVDRVATIARDAGLSGLIEVSPPAEPGTAWVVAENDLSWPTSQDSVAVDPATGTVIARNEFADWPLLAKLSSWGVALHMGYLFGLVNQILLAALALGLLCVTGWGYRMWWQRRPTRADRAAPLGAPPARGAWRQAHPSAVVVILVVAAAVGWALPLLGVSLAAFLVVDLLIGAVRRAVATGGGG
ncbi:PepSY domain-containing protein [Asanoa iriomotensis]|uniref:Membrane protein n=2 Tax=Asanoa iriomotensis TaxID=234613 RepID=A0ABQ4CD49_9ACTN|nr:membrane protein [Asanoa iriomotensis]